MWINAWPLLRPLLIAAARQAAIALAEAVIQQQSKEPK